MSFKVGTNAIFFSALLMILSGCFQKKTENVHHKKTKKQNNGSPTKTNNQSVTPDAKLKTDSLVIYNYGPESFLSDEFTPKHNLAITDDQAYQLKSPNGSQLPEEVSLELERLALAWEDNSDKVDQAYRLWSEDILDEKGLESFKPVFFSLKQSGVDQSHSEVLEENYKAAKSAEDLGKKLVVRGHSDPSEPSERAFSLSFDRAKSVKDALVKMGIEPDLIEIVAVGAKEPISWVDQSLADFEKEALGDQYIPKSNCRVEIVTG